MSNTYNNDETKKMLENRLRRAEARRTAQQQKIQRTIIGMSAILVLIVIVIVVCASCDSTRDIHKGSVEPTIVETTTIPETTVQKKKVYRYTTDRINLRSEPNTESEIVIVLDSGTKVTVIKKKGEWSKIKVKGKTGYVMTEFLSKKK